MMELKEMKKEFYGKFVCTDIGQPEFAVNPDIVYQWIETKIDEAKEEGFNAGCDYTTEQYENTLAEVSKVYRELTNNKLSKPNYKAEVILDEVRLAQEKESE